MAETTAGVFIDKAADVGATKCEQRMRHVLMSVCVLYGLVVMWLVGWGRQALQAATKGRDTATQLAKVRRKTPASVAIETETRRYRRNLSGRMNRSILLARV